MRLYPIVAAIVATTLLPFCCYSADTATAARQLLDELRRSQDSLKNVHMKATWDCSINGEKYRSHSQELFQDEYGRIVVIFSNQITYDQNEQPTPDDPSYTKSLYDGRLYLKWIGKVRQGESSMSELDLMVSIKEGKPSHFETIRKRRIPCYFAADHLLGPLEQAINKKIGVQIEEVDRDDGGKTLSVEFQNPSGYASGLIKGLIDSDRMWTIRKVQTIDLAGKVKVESNVEHVNLRDDIWFPVRGSLILRDRKSKRKDNEQARGDSEKYEELLFSVTEQTVNVGEMDESVFKYTLEPGTLVNDTRYNTSYRIGEEREYDESLLELANASRANIATKSQPAPPKDSGKSRLVIWISTALVVSLGVAICCFGWGKRRMSQAGLWFGAWLLLAATQANLARAELPDVPLYATDVTKNCGPVCVKYVDAYFGGSTSYLDVARSCPPTKDGTSLADLRGALTGLGYNTLPFRTNPSQLKSLHTPAILHQKHPDHDVAKRDGPLDHFVVVLGWNEQKSKFQLFDPFGGNRDITMSEMEQVFSGVGLMVSNSPLPAAEQLFRPAISWGSVAALFASAFGVVLALFIAGPRLVARRARVCLILSLGAGPLLVAGCQRAPDSSVQIFDLGSHYSGDVIKHVFKVVNTSDKTLEFLGKEST